MAELGILKADLAGEVTRHRGVWLELCRTPKALPRRSASSAPEWVLESEARKTPEVCVGGADLGAVLDCERGQVGISRKVRSDSCPLQQR